MRLKVSGGVSVGGVSVFLFQTGAIKSERDFTRTIAGPLFLFQTGAIKSRKVIVVTTE